MAEVQIPPVLDKPHTDASRTNGNGNSTGGTPDQSSPGSDNQRTLVQHQNSTGSMGSPEPIASDDLSEDLLQIGWRKYWSNREKMPYYFNKITNESLWEMPQIVHVSILMHQSNETVAPPGPGEYR